MLTIKKKEKAQRTIIQMLAPDQNDNPSTSSSTSSSNNRDRDKKIVLCRQSVILCALDFESFNISDRRGFRLFCEWNGIDPRNLPTLV